MYEVPSIDPLALRAELRGPNPPKLLDVREFEELTISRLPDVIHIPLHDLPERICELDRDAEYVVICRVGGRSAQATAYLLHYGFRCVRNLTMGMNGWARLVDPDMPEY